MILVTGATGNVGAELVRMLAGTGQRVRALTRSGEFRGLPAGAEPAAGDLNRPESLHAALTGVSGLFLLPGFTDMPGLLTAVRDAGVEHVVLLSGSSAAVGEVSNAFARYMLESEQAVAASSVPWTFLRPFEFMSNTLRWASQLRAGDVVRAAFAGAAAAVIDPYDIAAVAAVALTRPGHHGRSYSLSGPQALRPADQVAVLGAVLKRNLQFEAQPDDEARAEMLNTMAAEYVNGFFRLYEDGTLNESEVLPTVADLTGRQPRTFAQWAAAHADAFR